MPKKTSVATAPYSPDGSLLHHVSDYGGLDHYEDPETGEHLTYEDIWPPLAVPIIGAHFTQISGPQARKYKVVKRQPEWRPNEPFHATFAIDSVRSGRSAKYVILTSVESPEDSRTWPMFVVDLIDVMIRTGIERRAIMSGRWMVAKRGQNYGLRLTKEGE